MGFDGRMYGNAICLGDCKAVPQGRYFSKGENYSAIYIAHNGETHPFGSPRDEVSVDVREPESRQLLGRMVCRTYMTHALPGRFLIEGSSASRILEVRLLDE